MGSSFCWNDDEVGHRMRSVRALRAWIPAFAGMTVKKWFSDEDVAARYEHGSGPAAGAASASPTPTQAPSTRPQLNPPLAPG